MKEKLFCGTIPEDVRFSGLIGKSHEKIIANRLKKVNYANMVKIFRERTENDRGWRCEFWGKVVRSAILMWRNTGDAELLAVIKDTVADIMSTQTPDGCISSHPEECQLTSWDIWGRKYVLAGLLRYWELVEHSPEVLKCCCRLVDHLMSQVGPEGKNITDIGMHYGMASASILFAIVKLHRYTGEKKYLDYVHWMLDSGCASVHNIFDEARKGTLPMDIGNGKAYEMMSCFIGLAELYRDEPKPEYLESILKFYDMVLEHEIFITGVAGMKDKVGEYWFDGRFKQTVSDAGSHGETCVITTWIHFCYEVLRLTGDPKVADELEKSVYNGILGGNTPDGSSFVHANPCLIGGCKLPAPDQILIGFKKPFDGHDCCLAQGPEGSAMALPAALACTDDTLTINFYEDMSFTFNGRVPVRISGNYPFNGIVHIAIGGETPEEFTVKLRIPQWQSAGRPVKVNGTAFEAVPGTYLEITREWKKGDVIELDLDMSIRIVRDPGGSKRAAFLRGPLVLAQDSRLNGGAEKSVVTDGVFEEVQVDGFNVVCKLSNGTMLGDYISAGNQFCEENKLVVWSMTE